VSWLPRLRTHFYYSPWPDDVPWYANQATIGDFVRSYERHFHLEELVRYNTRVESVQEVATAGSRSRDHRWRVVTKGMTVNDREDGNSEVTFIWEEHVLSFSLCSLEYFADDAVRSVL
jgi:cation diffusion facilitator CzcD-associated flavoprotein CzcO